MTIHSMAELLRETRKQGFVVSKSQGGHYIFVSPQGSRAIGPSTPSDSRSISNTVADLRKLGFEPNVYEARLQRKEDRKMKSQLAAKPNPALVLPRSPSSEQEIKESETDASLSTPPAHANGSSVSITPRVTVPEGPVSFLSPKLDARGYQQGVSKAIIALLVAHPGEWLDVRDVAHRLGITDKQAGQMGRAVQNSSVAISTRRQGRYLEYCYRPGTSESSTTSVEELLESSHLPVDAPPRGRWEPPSWEPHFSASERGSSTSSPIQEATAPPEPSQAPPEPSQPVSPPPLSTILYERMPGAKLDGLDIICDEHGNLYVAVPLRPQWPSGLGA